MSLYPVVPGAGDGFAGDGLMVAFRLEDVASPLRDGRPLAPGSASALVIGGTERIRSGEVTVFCKVVAVAPAVVRRDGRVQAAGSPAAHATLGPLEEWLEAQAGPGVIEEVAERAVLDSRFVKGERERLLTRAFMIRAIVLMTLVPDAGLREAVTALAGDLAVMPWARPWQAASERALGDWRNALGPGPLEELRDIVLQASRREHGERDWRAACAGRLRVSSLDGTLIRLPDTPANRAMFGSIGTGDGSSPFPQVRALTLNDVSTRALLGMTHGPSGGGAGKAAGEQRLLDKAAEQYPCLFTMDRLWLMDRNFPGAARIARLIARTHVLIRLKSDIPLKRTSPVLADGSYLAELSGDGLTIPVRVIEYYAEVEGQDVPEMFCLVTDLTDIEEHPAPQLAALYKWRWDGSETALREAKATLDGAGPGTGPMLRSQSPALVRQELAAWAAAVEMTRGVARDAAAVAAPARKGRRAGQPVRPREISCARARRAVITAIRAGRTCYQALTRQIAKCRVIVDRNRHRPRKSKSPSTFGHATAKDTRTRIAPAIITMANSPA
ncbi:MAG TPA: transposase domain-containing protein [Streptosporangiaceae bacterium]|nr:transposase domain-containing protein [Streptosporangiaceae bacterium]